MPDEMVSALGSIIDITAVGEMFAIRQFGCVENVTQQSASPHEWEQNTNALH